MSETRQPPYPADTRAKGWRFELDYEKIEQSDTWDIANEIPLAQQCLLLMWYVAWKQVPCGSLPDDEATIRAKCKVPAKVWPQVKDVLMRGWWRADDGRLYHDTIVARVNEMLEYRRKTAERVAKHKEAMREQREGNALPAGEQQSKNDTGTGTGTTSTEAKASVKGAKAPSTRGQRLAKDWVLPKAWGDWALTQYPHWTADIVRLIGQSFGNHWKAKTGKDATKLDWELTWQNWCTSDITQRQHPPPAAFAETAYQRSMREKYEQVAPAIAAAKPGKPPNPNPMEVLDGLTRIAD